MSTPIVPLDELGKHFSINSSELKTEAIVTVRMNDSVCEWGWSGPEDGEVFISDELGRAFIDAMPWEMVRICIAPNWNGGIYKRREFVGTKAN